VIPSHPARARTIPHDRDRHRKRNVVGCFVAKLEQFRRVATRYEKTAASFLALVHLAATMIRLRRMSTDPGR
jgi:transposase